MVNITINNEKFSVADGVTVLKAAQDNGFEIPTFCNDEDLKPYGACRMCLVEITHSDGRKEITTSCNTLAEEGMEIVTDSGQVYNAQADMADLLLSRCPNVPSVKKMAASFGVKKPTFPAINRNEDCILCGMCVRACETKGKGVLQFIGRGDDRVVSTVDGYPSDQCKDCIECVKYCPTGAITTSLKLDIGKSHRHTQKIWKYVRIVAQNLLLIGFLFLMWETLNGRNPGKLINLFSRANPLQALMAMLAEKGAIVNFWPALITVAVTLLVGRVWCGWVCPTGAVFELYGPKNRRIKGQWLRYVKYFILFSLAIMAIFGNSNGLMWFEPITVFVRGLTALAKPGLDYVNAADKAAFVWPGFNWWAIAIPFVAALLLNLIERRFWCRYLCPLGALIGLLSKFSLFKRVVDQKACVKCGKCAPKCPMGAISPENDFKSDPAECIMCMDCEPKCPMFAIANVKGKMPQWHNEFDPTRREAIGSVVAGGAAVALLAANVGETKTVKSSVLRPPGALRDGETEAKIFLERCIRCDQCILGCPQQILKPSIGESGWDGLYTPIVDLSVNSCDPECNRCGQICPSEAIQRLPLEQKRASAKIGLAHVIYDVCARCNSCVRVCPNEAFEEVTVAGLKGVYPRVLADKCVGCGACLHVCPKLDEKAIFVYPLSQVPTDEGLTVEVLPEDERSYYKNGDGHGKGQGKGKNRKN